MKHEDIYLRSKDKVGRMKLRRSAEKRGWWIPSQGLDGLKRVSWSDVDGVMKQEVRGKKRRREVKDLNEDLTVRPMKLGKRTKLVNDKSKSRESIRRIV